MAPILCLIYKASLHQYKLPDDCKTALKYSQMFKKTHKFPTNYRPISLTCLSCKVFEHIIYSLIYIASHLETNSILCDAQHGFRSSVNNIASCLNLGEHVDVSFDFSKGATCTPISQVGLLWNLWCIFGVDQGISC